jgi:hypothetical protein
MRHSPGGSDRRGSEYGHLSVGAEVRGEHSRKKGFMSGFENIVAGSGSNNDPSYLERAKARWGGHWST